MSRRSSLAHNPDLPASPTHPRSLSRSSSTHSHLSLWSRKTSDTANHNGARRDSYDSSPTTATGPTGPRDPLKGHVGHLTTEQADQLEQFKQELNKRDVWYEEGVREEGGGKGRGRVDDATLLRFLRARKFDVAAAVEQYTLFVDWRKEKNVDDAYENYTVEAFEELRRVYPMWTGRRDLRGIPIYVYKISALTPATLKRLIPSDSASSSSIAIITLALIRFLLPFTSGLPREHSETPVSGTNSIVDVSGVGLSRFWGLRDHLQVASQVASANFPETIDRVFVVGAPSFFPTVFNWAKKWFDPGTVDKIHILSNDTLPTLLTMMPMSSIPKEYGGELDWKYGDDPNMDEEARELIGGKWIPGPTVWDLTEGGRVKPVGTEAGVRRDKDYVSGPPTPQRSRQSSIAEGAVGTTSMYKKAPRSNGHNAHDVTAALVGAGIAGAGVGAGYSMTAQQSQRAPSQNGGGHHHHHSSSHPHTSAPSPLHTSTVSSRNSPNEDYTPLPPPEHLPNGLSPNPDPSPSPASKTIPGSHSPINDFDRQLTTEPQSSHDPFVSHPSPTTTTADSNSIPPVPQDLIDARVREREQHSGLEEARDSKDTNKSTRDRTGSEAALKGWVPGSGVTEEEFMKAFGSMGV